MNKPLLGRLTSCGTTSYACGIQLESQVAVEIEPAYVVCPCFPGSRGLNRPEPEVQKPERLSLVTWSPLKAESFLITFI